MSRRFIERDEVARRLTYDLSIPIVRDAGRPGCACAIRRRVDRPTRDSWFCPIPKPALPSRSSTRARSRPSGRRLPARWPPPLWRVPTLERAIEIAKVRCLESIVVWGRSPGRACAFAERMQADITIPTAAAGSVPEAVGQADVICTVTSATEPVLQGAWVRPGTHVNLAGSSFAGPTGVDNDLVVRSRFIADSREGILRRGAEFLRAKEAGLVGDDHIVAGIGQVLRGEIEGRRSPDEITVYKSIGHVVQDLASAWALYSQPE